MQKWPTEEVNPLDLVLDTKNDRIDASSDSSQEALRLALYETEDVIDLYKDIIEVNGLLPTERIVVCKEARKFVVLEGNRRVCAVQSILNRKLIPAKYRDFLLAYSVSDSLHQSLKTIEVVVAPSREAADIAITRKHTDPSIKPWSPQAKYRRIKRLLLQGKTLAEIVLQFRQGRASVQRSMRELGIIEYVSNLSVWTAAEQQELESPKLKTNAFTRFFTLGGVCAALGIDYDDKGRIIEPQTKGQVQLFQRALELIARSLLLQSPDGSGKPLLNTRATAEQVFDRIESQDSRLVSFITRERTSGTKSSRTPTPAAGANQHPTKGNSGSEDKSDNSSPSSPQPSNQSGTTKASADKPGPMPKVAQFFEDLECDINDDVLKTYAREIRMIDYKKLTTSAAFLMRGLVEHTLKWAIRDKGLEKKLKEHVNQPSNARKIKGTCPECNKTISLQTASKNRDPGLADLIDFCITNADQLFANADPIRRNLNTWKTMSKDYVDIVIHGHYIVASESKLVDAAKTLRPFVKSILHAKKESL